MEERGHRLWRQAQGFAMYLTLVGYLAVVLYPMMWLLISSARESQELFTAKSPWGLPEKYTLNAQELADRDRRLGDDAGKILLEVRVQGVSALHLDQVTAEGGDVVAVQREGAHSFVIRLSAALDKPVTVASPPGKLTFTLSDMIAGKVARSADGLLSASRKVNTSERLVMARNYVRAWRDGKFGKYFFNSVFITLTTLVIVLGAGTMAAYVLGRFRFRGAKPVLFYFLAGMTFPAQLALIPLFFLLLKLGLLNTYPGLILVYAGSSLPFTIFVLTSFFQTLPNELADAAAIDGCGEFSTFWRVMLPLARPGVITVAIFNLLGIWNEYLYALVLTTDEKIRTLPLGLANLAINKQYDTDLGALFAGVVIVMVPALVAYMLLQRHLIRGLAAGAIKG